jgi:hypothetical protein
VTDRAHAALLLTAMTVALLLAALADHYIGAIT